MSRYLQDPEMPPRRPDVPRNPPLKPPSSPPPLPPVVPLLSPTFGAAGAPPTGDDAFGVGGGAFFGEGDGLDVLGEADGFLELEEHDVVVVGGGVVVGVDEGLGRGDALLRALLRLQAVVAHPDGDGAGGGGMRR